MRSTLLAVAGAAGVQTYEAEAGKLTRVEPPLPGNASAASAAASTGAR